MSLPSSIPQTGLLPGPKKEPEYLETTIEASLARLQQMHVALRNLRQSIPTVVDSVLPPSNPEQLYATFSSAVQNAGKDIRDFTELMQDGKTNHVFESARKSREAGEEAISCWKVEEHADWLNLNNVGDNDEAPEATDGEVDDKSTGNWDDGDPKAIAERFRQRHPDIDVSVEDDMQLVKFHIPLPANLLFQLRSKPSDDGRTSYIVEGDPKNILQAAIVDAINRRIGTNGLDHLLEMLASYRDVKTRQCDKCFHLLDVRNNQFPVVRLREGSNQPGETQTNVWKAMHLNCV